MPIYDPVSVTATFGNIPPLQTHYGGAQKYWIKAGEPIQGPVVIDGGLNVASGDMSIQTGSLTVVTGGIGVQGEIISHSGITNDGGPITSSGQNIAATEGGVLAVHNGNCGITMGAIDQELASIDMTGNNVDGPIVRLAVGGGSAVAPYETYKFGIYANQGGASPFIEALTVDDNALVKIAGAPVASPSRIAYAGVSGTTISLAVGTQTVSAAFDVKANHTYRVTVQGHIISGDTNPGSFVELDVVSPGSTVVVGLGRQIGGPNNDNGDKAYIGMFVAPADATGYLVKSVNATVASAILDLVNVSANTGILIEDLGVF